MYWCFPEMIQVLPAKQISEGCHKTYHVTIKKSQLWYPARLCTGTPTLPVVRK